MARRREQRLRTVLPVRVFGTDSAGKPFTDLAHTLDISGLGARLGGVQHALLVGDIVGVQRGVHKARFRVAWVGQRGTPSSCQIGVIGMEQSKNIWSVDFAEQQKADFYTPPSIPLDAPKRATTPLSKPQRDERRLTRRLPCSIGVEMRVEGTDVPLYARCTDLSTGGCYIETRAPLPRDTHVRLVLRPESTIVAHGVVRTSDASFGMGIQFTDLRTADATRLGILLAKLSGESASASAKHLRDLEVRDQMLRLTRELSEMEKRFATCRVDSASLADFRAALDKVRHSSWAVQQFAHAHPEGANAGQLAQAMTQERIKIATVIARELCVDLSSRTPDETEGMSDLFQAVGCLFQRVGHALARQQRNESQVVSHPTPAEILQLAPAASHRPS